MDIALYFLLTFPHILYAIVWTQPTLIKKYVSNVPYKINYCVLIFRILTYIYVGTYYTINLNYVIPFLLCFVVGQILNLSVYWQIGYRGVCYGIKYSKKIEWCYGFPFNIMNDPQYIGCVVSFIGLGLAYNLGMTSLYVAALYKISSMIESD